METETTIQTLNETQTGDQAQTAQSGAEESIELSKLRAELAKQKAATDKAAKEAADYKKQLRAKQSEEEASAEEKRLADEEMKRKLEEYEKQFTVVSTSKKIMSFVSDESVSTSIAEYLYGAEDVDAAIDAISKAWVAREKALRTEYGKIPAPSIGGADSTISRDQLDAMNYMERVTFEAKHPEEYKRLMGR